MKAAVFLKYGNNDVVDHIEIDKPQIKSPHEVLVAIHAASLNPVDFKIRNGKLKAIMRHQFPLIIGNDFSGVVIAVGDNVQKFKEGDEIYARVDKGRMGTCTEYLTIEEQYLAKKPRNISFVEAASIPLVGLTSWQALKDWGNLQSGDKVFIHAGSGGIGCFAIQLAKTMGLTVATTTSGKNANFVKQLGADIIIDYKTQDFTQEVSNYDMVYDTLGGDILNRSFSIVKQGGKVVTITATPDKQTLKELGANALLRFFAGIMTRKTTKLARQKNIRYGFLFMKANGDQLQQITSLIEEEKIKPVIDKTYPLDQTKDAMAYLEKGHARGKVVIEIKK
ncbi:NADP-dependent oxidoreductase [Candidatus Uabimicrobium amorphum]|uniref:NADPH:quinone reductase n=1 Tax=Uabimicrobium amorphum TaxID=2596890 RepID=A0A5S9IHX6_UABAM|nr:NADP-dependent oxidoreductase [Candidatus Uabimicrobium amorphum]BBM82139.1 NADPH:quinone reductase [Candidatus Uabimicrobium amorphum]